MAQAKRNLVLFIGACNADSLRAFHDLEKHLEKKLRVAFLLDKKAPVNHPELEAQCDFIFRVDSKRVSAAEGVLMPLKDDVMVVTCRSVFYMPLYEQLISLFPHLVMPTSGSLEACSNKLSMRRKFRRYYPEITPKFTAVQGAAMEDVEKVAAKVGFPCIVKPASLAASRLVAICYHKEELQKTLRKTFYAIRSVYKKAGAMRVPEVIVEQFMEGEQYAIDGYVDLKGEEITLLPPTHYKTGFQIGIDDFFTYRHVTPTKLSDEEVGRCHETVWKGIRALGLRGCMIHAEVVNLEGQWMMLEVDARMGGHRDFMYREAFGIPHGLNELLVRMGEKVIVKKTHKKYTACFNIFSPKPGTIKSIKGLKKVRELKSLKIMEIVTKVGQKTGLSKNGFKKVVDISMSNESREELFADVRRMEKAIKIEVV